MKPTHAIQSAFTVPNAHQQLSASRPIQVYTYYFNATRSRCFLNDIPACGPKHDFSGLSQLIPHDHEHHEIALVVAGAAAHRTAHGLQRIGRGSVLAVAPSDVHALEEIDHLCMVNCTYLTEYLFYDVREILSVAGLAPLFFHEAIYGGGFRNQTPQWPVTEAVLDACLDELRDIAEERARPDASPVYMRRTLEKLMLILHRSFIATGHRFETASPWDVRAAIERIEDLVVAGDPFDTGALARSMGYSRDGFARLFRRATGRTPMDYYQHRRVQQACCLLLNPDRNVTDIAHELGYYDAAHFSRLFKRYRGIGPKTYQMKYCD